MKRRAFTLVEMIIGIAIITILSGIILVSFSLTNRRRLEVEARNLLADLQWAREMSFTRHLNYTVTFNRTNDTYVIADSGGIQVRPLKEMAVDITSSPDSLTFKFPSGSPPVVVTTVNAPSPDIIRLELNGQIREIRVYEETGFLELSASI